jgi:limonene-1,2-epoxide hydrolase
MSELNWKIARNEGVVRAFLKGWDDRDVDACMAQCTDDMCYLNQPLEAIRGKAKVRQMIASIFAPAKKVEFRLVHVFGSGNKAAACGRWSSRSAACSS